VIARFTNMASSATARIPALGIGLCRSSAATTGERVAAVCDAAMAGGVLGALFLLPITAFPYAEAMFSVPKAALLHSLAALVLTAAFIRVLTGRPVAIRRSPLDLPIAAFLVVVLIGVLRARARDAALFGSGDRADGLFTLLSAMILYYAAFNLPYELPYKSRLLRQALSCLALSAGFVAMEGVAETLGFSLLGLDPGVWGFRAYSTSGNPNFLGGLLVLALPLPAVLLATSGPAWRPLWTLILTLILGGLLAAYTRSAWVGSIPALAVLLLLSGRDLRSSWRWLIAAAAIFLAFAILLETGALTRWRAAPAVASPAAQEGMEASSAGQGEGDILRRPSALERVQMVGTGSGRLFFWEGALGVVREQPIFGAGYANLFTAITRHLPVGWAKESPGTWVDKAHNIYLDYAASLGVPGLLAYLWIIGAFGLGMLRLVAPRALKKWEAPSPSSTAESRLLLVALLAGWAGYLVHLFFLFDTVDTLAIFWILMGLAAREMKVEGAPPTIRLRLPLVARLPLSLGAMALAALAINWSVQPVVAQIYLRSAGVAGAQHRIDEALGNYIQAASIDPYSERVQVEAAIALAVMGSGEKDPRRAHHLLDEAIRAWNRIIQRDPEFAYLYAMRGETYTRYPNGEHVADALADFRRAAALYPHYYHAFAGIADTAHALGLLGEAIAAERKLLELEPNNPQVLRLLAQDYVRVGRLDEAIKTWERLAGVSSDSPNIRLSIAQALLMLGRKGEARAELERARLLYPEDKQIEKAWQSLEEGEVVAPEHIED